jgi:hypothetical protein
MDYVERINLRSCKMPSFELEFDVQCTCSECNYDLDVEVEVVERSYGEKKLVVTTSPCEVCLQRSRQQSATEKYVG